jgi:hypothetical protein
VAAAVSSCDAPSAWAPRSLGRGSAIPPWSSIAETKPVLGLQCLVEVLHRKVPIACPVLLDDKLDLVHRRPPPGNPTAATIDQTFRPVRLVAVAKTPEVSLADRQQLCRLLATQSPRSITLQPFDIPRHPYLGSHPDPPVWKPSKNRTDRLLPNPDISSATDNLGHPGLSGPRRRGMFTWINKLIGA